VGQKTEDERGGYLVRGITDADIKIREISFDKITDDDF
jgi:hypothetical protein